MLDAASQAEDVPCGMLFATETMAELSARQGRVGDAVAIYRHLVLGERTEPAPRAPDPGRLERVERWKQRLRELEAKAGTGEDKAAGDEASHEASKEDSSRPASEAPASQARLSGVDAADPGAARTGDEGKDEGKDERASAALPSASDAPATNRARTALVISEPVRSGQLIYADGRDLIVLASVHSGAQVLADGHIHIYGTLSGRAIAGAKGAREAQVFCLSLEAELVGVDTGYLLSDNIPATAWARPARIHLSDAGTCHVAPMSVGHGKVAGETRRGRRFLW